MRSLRVNIPSPGPLASPLNSAPLLNYTSGTTVQPANLVLIKDVTIASSLYLVSSDAPRRGHGLGSVGPAPPETHGRRDRPCHRDRLWLRQLDRDRDVRRERLPLGPDPEPRLPPRLPPHRTRPTPRPRSSRSRSSYPPRPQDSPFPHADHFPPRSSPDTSRRSARPSRSRPPRPRSPRKSGSSSLCPRPRPARRTTSPSPPGWSRSALKTGKTARTQARRQPGQGRRPRRHLPRPRLRHRPEWRNDDGRHRQVR